MPDAAAPAFDGWLGAFFASYYRLRPINATFAGLHTYDDRLPDLTREGVAATLGDAEALLSAFAELPDEPLSTSQRIDRELAEGFLRIQRWESASPHFGASNPTLVTGEAIFGLVSLLLRDFAALDRRLESARSRLEAVPEFLAAATRRMTSAPAAWIERARRECEGARLLLEDVTLAYASLAEPARSAAQAFARFGAFLASVSATGQYAAGEEALELVLRHGHFLAVDADGLERLALERIAEEEAILATTPPPEDVAAPLEGEYRSRFASLWRGIWELVARRDVLTAADWPVHFVDRPTWARRAAPYLYFLPYRSPAPFDRAAVVEYLVPPGSDDSTIKLNHVVHHASIGHQVQNWFAARAASRVGQVAAVDCASRIAMLCGGTLAEGWATYSVDLADELGFLTPTESYSQHRARIRMAARALVDIRLHQGRISLAEAERLYIEQVGMPAAAARAETVKNSLFPGAACMYLAGWDGIHRLRRATVDDAKLSLRAFHDRLLSFGSVPVSLIAREMMEVPANAALAHF